MITNPIFEQFKTDYPEVGSIFTDLFNSVAGKSLDEKTKQLVYLGILTALRYGPAIKVHIQKALDAGATKSEIEEAMMLVIPAGGVCSFLSILSDIKDTLR
jgi:alkylhydroperoxidase/carboxymuconolactone decarboxylase family protein YurZ